MTGTTRAHRAPRVDPVRQHRDWLALVEVTGPFLSLPVLRETWPTLEALDPAERDALRRAHGEWRADLAAGHRGWVEFVLGDLLAWGDDLRWADAADLTALAVDRPEHDTTVSPSFVLTDPGARNAEVKPADVRLLGLLCDPGQQPTARIPGSAWAATPVDRVAQLCRHHDVPLGLVTDGRWWVLVRAPRGDVTSVAVFDAVAWPDAADRDVVRAFRSLLERRRFFAVPDGERLPALWKRSEDSQEDLTEALGVQVRQAVELLVTAIGRAGTTAGRESLRDVTAHEVYRGAVSVMMRVVFLLFAEERRLLPSDNELYAQSYSAGRLGAELEQRAREGSENELENSTAAWHRLLALFTAVHDGVDHPRLTIHPHDGSLFDPEAYLWMPRTIDDRTVLHMLRAVQHVWVGTGKNRERRTLSFRQLDVEQIGYVYEGLLSFEGYRAAEVVVGLVGKPGMEEEVALTALQDIPAESLAATLAERYKASGIGSVKAIEKRLAPLDPAEREAARSVLGAVVGQKASLIDSLLPFFRLLRTDLRELPVVIMPGQLYVTASALRRNTGTHYTPRPLAEDVVEHALEPLLYHVGPLQLPPSEKAQWTHRSSDELLQLKVADIAMGSAAFLVAAARYLGDALVNAWAREGKIVKELRDDTLPRDADEDPVVVEARRQVIEHCLYGVDINPMAVEMAKLSLWLVSMDPQRPFTFLDDRLVAGDSLLGVTSLEQIEYLCLDPKQAREWREGTLPWSADVRNAVAEATAARRRLTEIELGDDPIAALEHKRLLLGEADAATGRLRLFADLAVGAALAGSQKSAGSRDPRLREEAGEQKRVSREGLYTEAVALADKVAAGEEFAAREKARRWLETDTPADAKAAGITRTPLHWPLVFPEVFERGGFDAVIGNPPFLGGLKLQTATGEAYRDLLVTHLGREVRGIRGTADLVSYFLLRIVGLLDRLGQVGIIATNTLAQGDSRRVGLDQILGDGAQIRRAIKSDRWPSRSAALEYCAVWLTLGPLGPDAAIVSDGAAVSGITASLDPQSRVSGVPHRLASSSGIAFQGANVLGQGFMIDIARAQMLIEEDARYSDVLFPFIGGEDLNSRADTGASRWVIDFKDWPEERAKSYPVCYQQVRELVRPERAKVTYSKAGRDRWWQFLLFRPALRKAVHGLDRVLALTRVSNTVIPVAVPNGQVISEAVVVFATSDTGMLALVSSGVHYWWAAARASTLGAGIRYTPSDVFETFPLPDLTDDMRTLGDRLDTYRRSVMLARQTGLTKTYNLVFDPTVHDEDIAELRRIHEAIDRATVTAYGWDDLLDKLDHGFHPAGRDLRYTIGPWAQREILDRLLELNHERYEDEVKRGLHDKKKARTARASRKSDAEGLF
jgi:hypothetical protein